MKKTSHPDVIDLTTFDVTPDQIARSEEVKRIFQRAGWLLALPYALMAVTWLAASYLPDLWRSTEFLLPASRPAGFFAPALAKYVVDLAEHGKADMSLAVLVSIYGSACCALLWAVLLHRALRLTDLNHYLYMNKKRGKKVFDVYATGLLSGIGSAFFMGLMTFLLVKSDFYHSVSVRRPAYVGVPLLMPCIVLFFYILLSAVKMLRYEVPGRNAP